MLEDTKYILDVGTSVHPSRSIPDFYFTINGVRNFLITDTNKSSIPDNMHAAF